MERELGIDEAAFKELVGLFRSEQKRNRVISACLFSANLLFLVLLLILLSR